MAVFAKTISNGFAMGAIIGNQETMAAVQTSFISSAYWTEGIGPAAAVATIEKMKRVDVPGHLARLGRLMIDGWKALGQKHGVPVTTGTRLEAVSLGFAHPDAAAWMTLFTTRMLDHGFLAAGAFNATLAHQPRHVAAYLARADLVFAEIAEAIQQGDVLKRINGQVKHTMFARLAD